MPSVGTSANRRYKGMEFIQLLFMLVWYSTSTPCMARYVDERSSQVNCRSSLCLPYIGLMSLHVLGVVTMDWIKSYLANRGQYVCYNNSNSELKNIKCGVPQGSILGPVLFILYINDMCEVSKLLNIILFADDTSIFTQLGILWI